jgi:hypothetical protein
MAINPLNIMNNKQILGILDHCFTQMIVLVGVMALLLANSFIPALLLACILVIAIMYVNHRYALQLKPVAETWQEPKAPTGNDKDISDKNDKSDAKDKKDKKDNKNKYNLIADASSDEEDQSVESDSEYDTTYDEYANDVLDNNNLYQTIDGLATINKENIETFMNIKHAKSVLEGFQPMTYAPF